MCSRHDVIETKKGVRSRINPAHVRQEINDIRGKNFTQYYGAITSDVLILRATEGVLGEEDLLLPLHAVTGMLKEIPDARDMAIEGTNHFSILFNERNERNKALATFLQ